MNEKYKILILGDGRVAKAVLYFLKKDKRIKASFLKDGTQAKDCDLLIGALPGELGHKGLGLALKYKKNLIDISDIDPPFYLKNKKEITEKGIKVIPGCGFSPGIVNFILGRELRRMGGAQEVVVKAGSLSRKENYFPFLWCFEDLILEHQISSWQVIGGKKKRFPAFGGYEKEQFFGIGAESYYCASGFENLLDKFKVINFKTKVVRPDGFIRFFKFLKNEGFLDKKNYLSTKKIVERNLEDNITLGQLILRTKEKEITWLLKSFSKKSEALNSMQKITASVPACMTKLLLEGRIKGSGILFMEELAKDDDLFDNLIKGIRKENIFLKRTLKDR